MATFQVPSALAAASHEDEREDWLEALPDEVGRVADRWALTVSAPFEPGGQTAWVAPAHSGVHGDVVLKVLWRHMEAEQEAAGLREWNGEGAVRVFADERISDTTTALLLERCIPGTTLATLPEEEQDTVVAGLLRRLWREPAEVGAFRPLQGMCDAWADAFERKVATGALRVERDLADEGAHLFRALPASAPRRVLLCTDLHAENVLAAERESWLVIDPKPFVGDPAYDALQHLLNCGDRLQADPRGLVARVASLLAVDAERVLLWLFARCVVEAGTLPWTLDVARAVRPA